LAEKKAPLLPLRDLLEVLLDRPDETVREEEAMQQLRQLLEKQAGQPLDDITFERERRLLKERDAAVRQNL